MSGMQSVGIVVATVGAGVAVFSIIAGLSVLAVGLRFPDW